MRKLKFVAIIMFFNATQAFAQNEGFLANYYYDRSIEDARSTPVSTRVEKVLNTDFNQTSPPGLGRTNDFSVRWKGDVTAKHSETYTFYTNSDDGVRVTIDGQTLINNWTDHAPTWDWAFVNLEAGRTYRIVVEYYQRGGDSLIQFYWGSQSQLTELVPAVPGGARIGNIMHYNRQLPNGQWLTSHGDTFYSAWAADGTHFLMTDDTKGFNWELANTASGNLNSGRNVTMGTLTNNPWDWNFQGHKLDGQHEGLGFFKGENEAGPGLPYGGIWKGSGLASVDGVLYLTANDQTRSFIDNRVRASGSVILKSTDGGQSWAGHAPSYVVNTAPLPMMFNDPRFSRIAFVQYGQDGRSSGNPHDSDNYVYAISNGGEWDNGNEVYLGRVARNRIAWNDASDWQFFKGTIANQPQWGPLAEMQPIFSKTGKVSQTQMVYVPELGKYVLPNWYYVRTPGLQPSSPDYYGAASSAHTRWEFFMADSPWGPWTPEAPFFIKEWKTEGYYNPSIPNKFMSGKSMWLLFAGNYMDGPSYTLHYLNLSLD